MREIKKSYDLFEKKKIEVTHGAKPQPPFIAIFDSRQHYDIWVFCSTLRISLRDYSLNYSAINEKDLADDIWREPRPFSVELSGNIHPDTFTKINGLDFYKQPKDNRYCRICHNTGFARAIRGILLDKDDIPGQLLAMACWCKK